MKKIACVLLFGLISLMAKGQGDTILIRCAFVNDDGSTTLTWETDNVINANPIQHAVFEKYNIFNHQNNPPSLSPVGEETSITTGTFTDTNNNANNGSLRYTVNAECSPNSFVHGWINTIFLTATQTTSTTIYLEWNSLDLFLVAYNGNTGYEGKQYKIYRSRLSNGETDVLVGTVDFSESGDLIRFTDHIAPICIDTLIYYVEIENDHHCVSRSNKTKIAVRDIEVPDKPVVHSVSTNITTQKIGLTWTPSLANDVYGYIICAGEPCITLDTVWGKNSNSYTCNTCSPTTIHSVAIMSFDSCFNTSLLSDRHNNIVLAAQRPQCSDKVQFSWNKYINIAGDVAQYIIYSSTDNVNFTPVRAVSSQTTSDEININTAYTDYYFYVKAVGNGGYESTSNVVHVSLEANETLDYLYIRSVSVLPSNNQIEVSFFLDSTIAIPHYKLTRSADGISFADVATIPYSGKGTFSYIDNLPQSAASVIYTYVLQAPNVCATVYKASNAVSSMRLQASEVSAITNYLQWTTYDGWIAVEDYLIYRSADPRSTMRNLLGSSVSMVFNDNTVDMITDGYEITYNIVAMEDGYGEDGKQATASSSYATIIKQTLCWIPNAFTPKADYNNIFKPQISFVKNGSYRMRIYNRYGQVLFETKNLSQGWDGTYAGSYVDPSVYTFLIEFENNKGERQIKKGVVVVAD